MMARNAGFSLVELLVAASVTLLATAAIVAAGHGSGDTFLAQSEATDVQQRARVTASVLLSDLMMAGAGPDAGAGAGGFGRSVAPVLPSRRARDAGDPAGAFSDDAITVSYVPSLRAQSTIATDMPAASGVVRVNTGAGCPLSDEACGFSRAVTVVVYDGTGSADTFRVESVSGSLLGLRHTSVDSSKIYAAGSRIVEAMVRSYFLRPDAASDSVQLVRDDHDGAPIVPVVDHVVGLKFEYFGDASGVAVALLPEELTDGPWRPDAGAPNRFDADLLRVRAVGVTLRVEAASAAFRGPGGVLFARGGVARRGSRFVPDFELGFRVSPRNLWVAP